MREERWRRIRDLFDRVSACPAADRARLLDEVSGGDDALRSTLEDMLAADERSSPLDRHLVDLPGVFAAAERRAPPTTIGRYRLLRKIGEGGMGTVYLASRDDRSFERRVVIKLARAGFDDENARRLERERQILARLEHPAIARLYDGGTTESGIPYFVLEYVEGLPIDRHCQANGLDIRSRLDLFRQVAEAVRFAHQNLIVHRDLKPSNILVTPDGKPKLLDFGIAKLLRPRPDHERTVPWLRQLTPSHASPEHVRNQPVTTASDVYSLGVLLYQLLTDELPFRFADRSMRAIERAWKAGPVAPSVQVARREAAAPRRAIDRDLDSIALKALEHRPEARYDTVDRLIADLDRHRDGFPVAARPITWRYRARKLIGRHRVAFAVTALVAVQVLGATTAVFWQSLRIAQERDNALQKEHQKQAVLDTLLDIFRQEDPYASDESRANISVREALDRAASLRVARLDDQPEAQASVQHEIGLIYHHLGLAEPAREYLESALALRRALHGPEHASVADSLSALADAQSQEDGREAAKAMAAEAVAMLEDRVGEDDPVLVRPLNTLVAILCARGEYDEARVHAEDAVRRAVALPATDYRRAFAANNLAAVRGAEGDYSDAARHYGEAIRIQEGELGSDHLALVPFLINRGVALRNLGKLDEALADYQRAWTLIEPRGAEYPLVLPLINNLGRLHFARGDFESAREIFERGLEVLGQRGLGASPLSLRFELRIAETRNRLGESRAAESILRRLLSRWSAQLGDQDPWIQQTRSVLGESLRIQGRLDEAETLLVSAFDALRGHPKERVRREAFERLAALLETKGRGQEIAALERGIDS